MTVETSGNIKTMMLNLYNNISEEYFESSKQSEILKNLVFSLTLFHALLIDRKKFGPIGWNSGSTYDFSDNDLTVTKDQIYMLIEESEQIQITVLRILAAVIN